MANSLKQHELVIANQLIRSGWHSTPFIGRTPRIREAAAWCRNAFGSMYTDITEWGDWYGLMTDESFLIEIGVYFIFRREQDLTAFLLRWA